MFAQIETPPVSWLSGPLTFRWKKLNEPWASTRPSHPGPYHSDFEWFASKNSGVRRKNPPYSRASATALHRLPMRGVSGDCERCREALARIAFRNSTTM